MQQAIIKLLHCSHDSIVVYGYCSFHEPCKVETVNAKHKTVTNNSISKFAPKCMKPFKSISITESSDQIP